jgi:hypothetical protein
MEVKHTHAISIVPSISNTIALIIPISILFGLAAMLFPEVPIIGGIIFKKTIYPPLHSWAVLYLHLPYISQERQNI